MERGYLTSGVRVTVIVITGGIGAGKSLALDYFRSRGALVLYADDLAHSLLEPGAVAYDPIVSEFGSSVLDSSGRIDRSRLARAAFASASLTRKLNAIVHPALTRETEALLADLRERSDAPSVVAIEVPLLVEAPEFARLADVVLAIAANSELRLSRTAAAGMDAEDAARRLERQATDGQRERIADRVIVNEGTPEEFVSKLASFWDEMVASRGSA